MKRSAARTCRSSTKTPNERRHEMSNARLFSGGMPLIQVHAASRECRCFNGMPPLQGHAAASRACCRFKGMLPLQGHAAASRACCRFKGMPMLRGHAANSRACPLLQGHTATSRAYSHYKTAVSASQCADRCFIYMILTICPVRPARSPAPSAGTRWRSAHTLCPAAASACAAHGPRTARSSPACRTAAPDRGLSRPA